MLVLCARSECWQGRCESLSTDTFVHLVHLTSQPINCLRRTIIGRPSSCSPSTLLSVRVTHAHALYLQTRKAKKTAKPTSNQDNYKTRIIILRNNLAAYNQRGKQSDDYF